MFKVLGSVAIQFYADECTPTISGHNCKVYIDLQALNGFLMVVTQDFNVLYVSETIQNYLGYPQVGRSWLTLQT